MPPSSSTLKIRRTPEPTPSFVCELALKVSASEEKKLLARLEVARQVYNGCLGEALKRLDLVRQSQPYRVARSLAKDDPERKRLFAEAKARYQFNDASVQHYAVQLRHSWVGDHLDVHTTQKLATRAFRAVERVLYGKAQQVYFKRYDQIDSVESKSNEAGIRWREDHLEWNGLHLKAIIDPEDLVVAHGLSSRVKYVRLVRRKVHGRNRFYAQLICEGTPYQKPKHTMGEGTVGLDIGPSTVAIVSQTAARLELFCSALEEKEQEIRLLQRKLDRQQRANNPDHYKADGTVKRGPKKWVKSSRQKETEAALADLHRRWAAQRKSLHGRLINEMLALGNVFKLEALSYKAFQKQYGKSVARRAPGMFVAKLRRKAEAGGEKVIEFPTGTTKLSRTCHCGRVRPKDLSQRWHECPCGVRAQRDLYSAFLARFVDAETNRLHADQAACAWSGAEPLLRAAWSEAMEPASGRPVPSSFGASRSPSGSSAEGERAEAKATDVVAY